MKLIINCSKSKNAVSELFIPEGMNFKLQSEASAFWIAKAKELLNNSKLKALQLYNGRGFKKATASGIKLENLFVVSTGLGLLSVESPVIGYNLTISSVAPNRLQKKIILENFAAENWWAEINKSLNGGVSVASVVAEASEELIIIAVSRDYLKLIEGDLLSIPEAARQNLRIIGSNLAEVLSPELFDYYLNYDCRFEGLESGLSGSKIDYSIRCAIHFIQNIVPSYNGLREQQLAIMELMESVGDVTPSNSGSRAEENEVLEFLQANYARFFGRKTLLLAALRKRENMKCSNQRFEMLYNYYVEGL